MFDKAQMAALKTGVKELLAALKPTVDAASVLTWKPEDGQLLLLRRSVLRRQHEALLATADLVERELGYAAAPLLRPACEEFVWMKYLAKVPPSDGEVLVLCRIQEEVFKSLRVQDEFAGRAITRELGLDKYLAGAKARKSDVRDRLKRVGERLHWPKRDDSEDALPSIFWLAKQIDEEELFTYLYHATSRFVHFSPVELLRRAWGFPGQVVIGSHTYQDYWGAFALRWGAHLFLETTLVIVESPGMPEDEIDEDAVTKAVEQIASFGKVPIITAAELAGPP